MGKFLSSLPLFLRPIDREEIPSCSIPPGARLGTKLEWLVKSMFQHRLFCAPTGESWNQLMEEIKALAMIFNESSIQ